MSQWLDWQPALVSLLAGDLRHSGLSKNRTAGMAGGGGAALRAAQATATVELRRTGVSPGGFGVLSCVCAIAAGLVTEEIGAASDN
jgi:hypothetical protein